MKFFEINQHPGNAEKINKNVYFKSYFHYFNAGGVGGVAGGAESGDI